MYWPVDVVAVQKGAFLQDVPVQLVRPKLSLANCEEAASVVLVLFPPGPGDSFEERRTLNALLLQPHFHQQTVDAEESTSETPELAAPPGVCPSTREYVPKSLLRVAHCLLPRLPCSGTLAKICWISGKQVHRLGSPSDELQ